MQMPALALAAVAGRRAKTVELAQEIERRGYQGIYCASFGDSMGLCLSMAHATSTIRFGTAIANIYTRHPFDMAQSAAYIHEIAQGRFYLGLGVSHGPMNERLGLDTGKPLSDMRNYIAALRAAAGKQMGELPPIVLATLRKKMVDLSVEIGEGAVWANASRSHLGSSLSAVPSDRLENGFFIGDMLADLHRRRHRGRRGRLPSHPHRICHPSELPELLERSGLRRRDGGYRDSYRCRRARDAHAPDE